MSLLKTNWFRRHRASRQPPLKLADDAVDTGTSGSPADLFSFDTVAVLARTRWVVHSVTPTSPMPADDLLRLVADADWPETHPLRETFAAELSTRPTPAAAPPKPPEGEGLWHLSSGRGLQGYVNGFHILIGNEQLMRDAGIVLPEAAERELAGAAREGRQAILIGARRADPASGESLEARRSLLGLLTVAAAEVAECPPEVTDAPAEPEPEPPPSPAPRGNNDNTATPSRWRKLPWRAAAALAAVSAVAGLYASSLRVPADELVVIRRLGRVVAVASPGLHFRPLWPVESRSRVPALKVHLLEVRLGSAAAGEPVLCTSSSPGDDRQSPQLMEASAVIECMVGDPVAFAVMAREPGAMLAPLAEATLREALRSRRGQERAEDDLANLAVHWRHLLAERLAVDCPGFRLARAVILSVHPSPGQENADVAAAAATAWQAQARRAEAAARSEAEAMRILSRARVTAGDALSEANRAKAAMVEAARGEANRVLALQIMFRESPATAWKRLILDLFAESLPGRRNTQLNAALGDAGRLVLRKERGAELLSLNVPPLRPPPTPERRQP